MRIAYFTDTYTPQVNGVTFAVQAHTQLLARRHEVTIFAPSYDRTFRQEQEGRVSIVRFPSWPLPTYKEVNIPVVTLGRFNKLVMAFDPEILHFHDPGTLGLAAIRLASKTGKPLVGTYHSLFAEILPPMPPFRWIMPLLRRQKPGDEDWLRKAIWQTSAKIYNQCDVVISPSKVILEQIKRHGHTSPGEVISNGIDTTMFEAKTTYGGKRIIYVGRVSFEKKLDVVIRAFKLVAKMDPEASLMIVGGGPASDEVRQQVKDLGLEKRVQLAGYVGREKLPAIYRGADVFVTASAMEVQPITLLEAMAAGLPIVGVDFAGVQEMIRPGENGYLVPVDDSEAMARKIEEIIRSLKLARKLGQGARKIAVANSLEESAKKLEAVYQRLAMA